MLVTNELDGMLAGEARYIARILADLEKIGETLTEQAERNLRMGYRTEKLIKLRLRRFRKGLDVVTGKAAQA